MWHLTSQNSSQLSYILTSRCKKLLHYETTANQLKIPNGILHNCILLQTKYTTSRSYKWRLLSARGDTLWHSWLRHCATGREGHEFDWDFSSTQSFLPHCGLGVESASNRNEYQGYLLGGKGGWCVGLITLSPSCANCLEILGVATSWSPKGSSRPVMG
jgi:hypothetical protein